MLDALKPILRAAAPAAFLVGTLLFLLDPPSLSGAPGLIAIVLGGLGIALLTAWATVALAGRGQSEAEFERVVERTEALARKPDQIREPTDFERIVGEAIDRLPEQFRRLAEDETPVVVSRRGHEVGAYGQYFGDTIAREHYEDRIVVYQDTLERDFGHDPELLAAQVERTLRHEIAHHLGWAEEGARELGL